MDLDLFVVVDVFVWFGFGVEIIIGWVFFK